MIAQTQSNSPTRSQRFETTIRADNRTEPFENVFGPMLSSAKRLIVEKPGTCIAASFLIGGALAWLISKTR